ncbi:MAG TPA: PAS domain-containing protein, partial [Thermotoga sp.]|nr:PAS domain-containing protein [Thermotoga sp.]
MNEKEVEAISKNIWELLWKYDPNGLVVVNEQVKIVLTNPAFCKMFKVSEEEVLGQDLEKVIGSDISCFKQVFSTGENIVGKL